MSVVSSDSGRRSQGVPVCEGLSPEPRPVNLHLGELSYLRGRDSFPLARGPAWDSPARVAQVTSMLIPHWPVSVQLEGYLKMGQYAKYRDVGVVIQKYRRCMAILGRGCCSKITN